MVELLACRPRGSGFNSRPHHLNFRYWLSPASKSPYITEKLLKWCKIFKTTPPIFVMSEIWSCMLLLNLQYWYMFIKSVSTTSIWTYKIKHTVNKAIFAGLKFCYILSQRGYAKLQFSDLNKNTFIPMSWCNSCLVENVHDNCKIVKNLHKRKISPFTVHSIQCIL